MGSDLVNTAVGSTNGPLAIESLRPGETELLVLLEGYKPLSRKVALKPGETVELAVKLELNHGVVMDRPWENGLGMRFVAHTDIVALKAFMRGLMTFEIHPLPADPLLLVHLSLVALLMIVFPISKLLHAPGLFFSPTRYQVDNPREARHVAACAPCRCAGPRR